MRSGQAFAIVRLIILLFGVGITLLALPKTAAAQGQDIFDDECFEVTGNTPCDVEGFSAILASTSSTEIDTDVATEINDFELEDEGYLAQVDGAVFNDTTGALIDETEAFDDGTGLAEAEMSDPVSINSVYELDGDHSLVDGNNCDFDPDCGQSFEVGQSGVLLSTDEPTITNMSPLFGYVGTSGNITFSGTGLVDPFTGTVTPSLNTGTGMTVAVQDASPDGTSVTLGYTITQNATTGPLEITLTTRFGNDHGDQQFTVGDPSPVITSVSPAVWQAGTASLPITITGSGFGTSPTVTVAGTGVSLVSVGSTSDTNISATVSIASNAPNGTATVTVQSNGYNGSGFQPATSGQSSTSSYNVGVQATPGPAPTILLYTNTNITNQTTNVVAGQQIALSATVTLPQGVTVSTQQWSMPDGTVVGGYNASTAAGCVVLIAGQSSQTGACTGSPVSTTTSSFAFYWIDSANSRQITYTYTASNGSTNSATTTFSVATPTGASVTVTPSPVAIINPPTQPISFAYPLLEDGGTTGPGMEFLASATFPSGNNGTYQWVQLIQSDATRSLGSGGPSAVSNNISGAPELDGEYPYGAHCLGQHLCTVTTTNVTDDTAQDSPLVILLAGYGEYARSFSATMYLMWTPNADSRCSGNPCTIPVPLGSVPWHFAGDAINTLQAQENQGLTFPLWILNAGIAGQPGGFQAGASFPVWSNFVPLQ